MALVTISSEHSVDCRACRVLACFFVFPYKCHRPNDEAHLFDKQLNGDRDGKILVKNATRPLHGAAEMKIAKRNKMVIMFIQETELLICLAKFRSANIEFIVISNKNGFDQRSRPSVEFFGMKGSNDVRKDGARNSSPPPEGKRILEDDPVPRNEFGGVLGWRRLLCFSCYKRF